MVAKKTTIFRTKGNFVLKTAKMRFYKTNTLYLYNIEMMKNTITSFAYNINVPAK